MIGRKFLALTALLVFAGLAVGQSKSDSSPPAQTAPSGEAPCKVGQGVTGPRLIYAPNPKLPEREKSTEKTKKVVAEVSLIVTTEGKPKDVTITKSVSPEVDKLVTETLNTWKFDPAIKECKPVAVRITVEVTLLTTEK